jgi:hypothetical protein
LFLLFITVVYVEVFSVRVSMVMVLCLLLHLRLFIL